MFEQVMLYNKQKILVIFLPWVSYKNVNNIFLGKNLHIMLNIEANFKALNNQFFKYSASEKMYKAKIA